MLSNLRAGPKVAEVPAATFSLIMRDESARSEGIRQAASGSCRAQRPMGQIVLESLAMDSWGLLRRKNFGGR